MCIHTYIDQTQRIQRHTYQVQNIHEKILKVSQLIITVVYNISKQLHTVRKLDNNL